MKRSVKVVLMSVMLSMVFSVLAYASDVSLLAGDPDMTGYHYVEMQNSKNKDYTWTHSATNVLPMSIWGPLSRGGAE